MTPLRRRMTEDMQVRNFSPHTQDSYVQQVSLFARHFSKSPEVLGPGGDSFLPSLSDQRKEVGSQFHPHRRIRPAFPLQSHKTLPRNMRRRQPRSLNSSKSPPSSMNSQTTPNVRLWRGNSFFAPFRTVTPAMFLSGRAKPEMVRSAFSPVLIWTPSNLSAIPTPSYRACSCNLSDAQTSFLSDCWDLTEKGLLGTGTDLDLHLYEIRPGSLALLPLGLTLARALDLERIPSQDITPPADLFTYGRGNVPPKQD